MWIYARRSYTLDTHRGTEAYADHRTYFVFKMTLIRRTRSPLIGNPVQQTNKQQPDQSLSTLSKKTGFDPDLDKQGKGEVRERGGEWGLGKGDEAG